jgi:hypothetical protein
MVKTRDFVQENHFYNVFSLFFGVFTGGDQDLESIASFKQKQKSITGVSNNVKTPRVIDNSTIE